MEENTVITEPVSSPNSEDKKKKYRVVTQVVLLVGACVLLYFLIKFAFSSTGFDSGTIKKMDSTIVSMKEKIDSVEQYQKFLIERSYVQEARTIELKEDIDKVNAQVKKTSKDINELRKTYNEKINTIDGYSVAQIDSFFRARYGYYY